MSILGKLLRGNVFDNPQVPLTSANVAYFLDLFGGGRTDSNEIVTPLTAMQQTTVYACVRILADQPAQLPLHVMEIHERGKKIALDHPYYDLLALNPNPDMSSMTWRKTLGAQLQLWGNAYSEIQRNGGGQAVALWPRGAWKTKPVRRNGELWYETTDNEAGTLRYIHSDDMVHLMCTSLDGLIGLSPIEMVRQSVGTGLAVAKFGARFFGNYATPKLAITAPNPMKPEDKTKARADWEQLQSGANQHRVAILDNGMEIKQLSIPPDQAQFIGSSGMTDEQIAAAYGVPLQMIGKMGKQVKSTVEQQAIEFLQYTLQPILTQWKQELQRKLMPRLGRSAGRYVVQFETRDLLRPDAASRTVFYQSGIQNGFLSDNEVREFEGLNPIGPEGDQHAIQLNMQPLSALGDTAQATDDEILLEEENGLLSRLNRVYSGLFVDGLRRFTARSRRDSADAQACIFPALEAIAAGLREMLPRSAREIGREIPTKESERMMRTLAEGVLRRSKDWAVENIDAEVRKEALRAIKAMIFAVYKDAAAARAARDIGKEDEGEDDDQRVA